MQVIAADAHSMRADRLAVARSAVIAVLLLAAGAALAWLCLGTPLLERFMPNGRPTAVQTAVGVLAWGLAIAVPAALVILGIARLVSVLDTAHALRPRAVTRNIATTLGSDHLAATDLLLPGGRRIDELVLGPFGIAVLVEAPPPSHSRHVGTRWEMRDGRGQWIAVEGPVERAARDAERVRSWMASHDRDFTVRVYAAVVADDPRLTRTPTVAVVRPGELGGWLTALPFQRGLNADRHDRLVELIRSVAIPR